MKLAILGIDSLCMDLILRLGSDCMPFLCALIGEKKLTKIRSCDPPITIPAWAVMTTGKDPGELGIYGFRSRISRGSTRFINVDSSWVRTRRVWDSYTNVFVASVPLTWPVRELRGEMIGGILANGKNDSVWPKDLKIQEDWIFDISDYRSEDHERIIKELEKNLDQSFSMALGKLKSKLDFFMMVLIGADRIAHTFWRYVFEDHPRYEKNDRIRSFFRNWFSYLDRYMQKFWDQSLECGFEPVFVSDHGVRPLKGIFHCNQWLYENGFLQLSDSEILLEKSSVFAQGGYCARLYMNLCARDPLGVIEDEQKFKEKLTTGFAELSQKTGIDFQLLWTKDLYKRRAGVYPDALLYVGGLDYRCSASLGPLFSQDNDTGPDSVNHDFYGILASRLDLHEITDICLFGKWLLQEAK